MIRGRHIFASVLYNFLIGKSMTCLLWLLNGMYIPKFIVSLISPVECHMSEASNNAISFFILVLLQVLCNNFGHIYLHFFEDRVFNWNLNLEFENVLFYNISFNTHTEFDNPVFIKTNKFLSHMDGPCVRQCVVSAEARAPSRWNTSNIKYIQTLLIVVFPTNLLGLKYLYKV